MSTPEDVKRRLMRTLERLFPGRTEYTRNEVMEALDVMGELPTK